jgi:hypothetical protein
MYTFYHILCHFSQFESQLSYYTPILAYISEGESSLEYFHVNFIFRVGRYGLNVRLNEN